MTVGELLVKLGVDLSQYDRDLSKAEKRTQSAGIRLGDILQNAFSFTIGMGMFEAIKRGFQTVAGEAVNFNSMMEQARIGFATMLGSAERAQAFLNEMADFAARTPFEFPELLDAAKRMMAMGFAANEVLPTLKAVGDAAAGLGVGKEGIDRITLALGQMRAKSKVSAEEMMQLTEAGVPAWEILAEAMGKSTAEVMKLAERGLIPANQAIQILVEGMEKRFPNMMQNMENTWEGVTSTIKDVWRMTVGALTQTLFSGLVGWLRGIRDTATSFYNLFSGLRKHGVDALTALRVAVAKTFSPDLAAVIHGLVNAIRTAWTIAVRAAVMIKTHWAIIKPIVVGTITAFLLFRVVIPVFQVLRTTLLTIVAALGAMNIAAIAAVVSLTAAALAWSKYAASIEKANLDRIMRAFNQEAQQYTTNTQASTESTQQQTDALGEQTDALKEAGKAASKNIQSFDEVHQIMDEMADASLDAATGLDNVAASVPGAPDISVPLSDWDISLEQPTLKGFWDWLVDGLMEKLNEAKQKVLTWLSELAILIAAKKLWDSLQPPTLPPPNVAPVTTALETLEMRINALKQALADWASVTSQAISTWAADTWNAISGWATNVGTAISTWATNTLTAISGWATNAFNPIQGWATDTSTTISQWITNTASSLSLWADNVLNNLFNWARNSALNISNWVVATSGAIAQWVNSTSGNVASWAKNVATNIYNFASQGYSLIYNWGYNSLNAFNSFLNTTANNVVSWANSIGDTLARWASEAFSIIASLASAVGANISSTINVTFSKIQAGFRAVGEWISENKSWLIPVGVAVGLTTVGIATGGLAGAAAALGGAAATIPAFAEGGLVTAPTLAMVGEAGPEAIIPLSRSGFVDDMATTIAQAVYSAIRDAFRVIQAEGGTRKEIILEVDGKRLGQAVLPSIIAEAQRTGIPVVLRSV